MGSRLICFVQESIIANYTVVAEFYANASATTFGDALVTNVRGVQVSFNPNLINQIYGLPNADNQVYKDRAMEEKINGWLISYMMGSLKIG